MEAWSIWTHSNDRLPVFILHIVAYKFAVDFIDILIKNGANINELAEEKTPLAWAIQGGKRENVRFLLESGADIAGKCSKSPLFLALQSEREDIFRLVRSYYRILDPDLIHYRYPQNSYAKIILMCLNKGFTLDVDKLDNFHNYRFDRHKESLFRDSVGVRLVGKFDRSLGRIPDEPELSCMIRFKLTDPLAAYLQNLKNSNPSRLEYLLNCEDEFQQKPLDIALITNNIKAIEELFFCGANAGYSKYNIYKFTHAIDAINNCYMNIFSCCSLFSVLPPEMQCLIIEYIIAPGQSIAARMDMLEYGA